MKDMLISRKFFTFFVLLLLLFSTFSTISMSEKGRAQVTEKQTLEKEDVFLPSDYGLQKVVVQPNATVGKDTHIWENFPDNNYGVGIDMAVGTYPGSNERRALLQFKLPDNVGVLKDVTLSVHGQYALFGSIPVNVKVHPLLDEWDEGNGYGDTDAVNWTYRTEDEMWDTPGGDFDEGVYAYREPSLFTNTGYSWYSWDITKIAQRWDSGELENHGVIMVADDPSVDLDFFYFHSSDYLTASYRPKLTITYHAEIDPPLEEQTLEMNGAPEVVDLAGRERGNLERLTGELYGSVNSLPFSGIYGEIRYQNLYPQEEIGVAGDITRISFNRSDLNKVGNFSNFKMSLGHSILDSVTDTFDDNHEGLLYEVFSRDNLVVNSSNSDSWVHFELDTAFPYDGSRNLLMDIQWVDSGGTSIGLQAFNHGSNRRVFSDTVTSSTGMADGTSLKARFGVEVTDSAHFSWEAQSLDPDMFKAEVVGTELTITPMPNARGVGTLALSLFNNNGHYVTQEVDVTIGMKDAFISGHSSSEYYNYGGYELMGTGGFFDNTELRSLIEFNLPPEEGVLKRASLSMYCGYMDIPNSNVNVSLFPVTNSWFENDLISEPGPVNWYERTDTADWDTPGGDFNTSYVSYRNISQEGLWYDWDITEIVRAWYAGDIENNGLMIIGDDHDAEPYNRA
ncbi:MAG: DNRLRE domain-containing protein, partial [Thermoplasmata archaeon]